MRAVEAGERPGSFRETWQLLVPALLAGLDAHPLARRVLRGQEPDQLTRILDIPAIRDVRALLAGELADAQRRGVVRPDIDADEIAAGLESVVLAVLVTLVQAGGRIDPARQRGVLALVDAALH